MAESEEDRISSLHEHLLLEIISRVKIMDAWNKEERLMSTKEVIKTTTTISKRWRHLWARLPTLVFIQEDFMIKDEDVLSNGGYRSKDVTNLIKFIDKTLAQCATDVNLTKFKLEISDLCDDTLPVNHWIHNAITRNVQEIDLRIMGMGKYKYRDDELFFNNSCLVSIKVSRCVFNPPNGTIRWDKLKFLRIDEGELDEVLIGKILSGSPCLETFELNECLVGGCIAKSLFGNFGVLEQLSCKTETYETIIDDDELFFEHLWPPAISMQLSRGVFDPPNGVIRLDKLKRINVTSKSVKNLVLSGYGYRKHYANSYIDTLKINAPYILTLTIEGKMRLEKFLLEDVSSLIKAHLNYRASNHFSDAIRRDSIKIEEELLRGLFYQALAMSTRLHLGLYVIVQRLSLVWKRKVSSFVKVQIGVVFIPTATKVFSLFQKVMNQ